MHATAQIATPQFVEPLANTAEQQSSTNQPSTSTAPVRADGLNAELAARWLKWQCRMIADVISAAVYNPQGELLAQWPADADGAELLANTAGLARQSGKSVIKTENNFGPANSRIGDVLACAILANEKPIAYVAVLMTPRPQSRQNAVLQLIQWSGYWLESLAQLSAGIHQEASEFTRSLLTRMANARHSRQLAMELANSIATRLGCERVSLGIREGLVVRLQCVSGLASFDPRTRLIRAIESAMEESLDSGAMIVLPSDHQDQPADKAHRELISQHGSKSVCSLPLQVAPLADHQPQDHSETKIFGALTLERSNSEPFDRDTIEWCERVLEVVVPVMALKKFEERPLWRKISDTTRNTLLEYLGPDYMRSRAIAAGLLGVLLLTTIFNGTHQVSAEARISGDISQVVAAPLAGFVKSAEVRAGDQVKKGDLLAKLDDRSLQLELNKWQSERNQTSKAYHEAMAKKARTELSILRAKAEQIDAELALVEQRIKRTRLLAPIDGFVVSGDLAWYWRWISATWPGWNQVRPATFAWRRCLATASHLMSNKSYRSLRVMSAVHFFASKPHCARKSRSCARVWKVLPGSMPANAHCSGFGRTNCSAA